MSIGFSGAGSRGGTGGSTGGQQPTGGNGTTFPGNPVGVLVCTVIWVPGSGSPPQVSCTNTRFPTAAVAAIAAGGGGLAVLLSRAGVYVKSHPVTVSFNEIFAFQATYQHSTGTLCLSGGLGASFPPTKAVTVGLLNEGNMANRQAIVSGPSYSFGANLFGGYQGSFSSSGTVGGPTATLGYGLSGSYTVGHCTTLP